MKTSSTSSRFRARPFLVALFAAILLVSPARADGGGQSRSWWTPIEWALGSQRRMLQVATVGMCLAIYIILWRK